MDILVKSVLNYVQAQKGHANSVLAGGAVRDIILGLPPKDYDIVIPSDNHRQIDDLAQSIVAEFGVTDMVLKTKEYGGDKKKRSKVGRENPQRLTSVWGFTFEGKRIDLIGHREVDDEDFPQIVIDKFDFGINMAYDTGSYLHEEDGRFVEDVGWRKMTLYNLDGMEFLPNAIGRYNTLNARYQGAKGIGLKFDARCLKLDRKEEPKEYYEAPKKKNYTLTGLAGAGGGTGATQAAWNPTSFTVPDWNAAPAWDAPVFQPAVFEDEPQETINNEF